MTSADTLGLAVAQVALSGGVPTATTIRASGERVRANLAASAEAGARLVHFPEGVLAYPRAQAISSQSSEPAEADWTKADWPSLRHELELIAACCRKLRLWAVVGAPHQLSGSRRPHNSLYVISDRGQVASRYDKRRLSSTEVAYLYTPGSEPVTFDVDGFRFGMAVCLEMMFPELFVEYAAMGVDAVLVSSAPDPGFGRLARAHAQMNAITVAVAFGAGADDDSHRSGVCTVRGWIAKSDDAKAGLVVCEIDKVPAEPSFHRKARSGLYTPWLAVDDPRSRDRRSL